MESNNNKNNLLEKYNVDVNLYGNRVIEILKHRTILIYLNFVCLIAIILLIIAIYKISELRHFDPFVIKIEESTGNTSIIKSVDKEFLSTQESLTRYFIKKYIIARESYNMVDYTEYSQNIIRSFSNSNIYNQYLGFILKKENNLQEKYKDKNSTYITIKSWSRLEQNKYIVRFIIKETSEQMLEINKVAIIEIDYVPSLITDSDLNINPVGFQVIGYNVSDDTN